MYLGKPSTNSNAEWHRPQAAACRTEDELMEKSNRTLGKHGTTDPLDKIRLLCLARGASGIMALGRIFRRIYDESKQQLTKEEFLHGIKKTGLDLSDEDAEELFAQFDPEDTGLMSLDKFLKEIQPPMSESRRAIVERVFKKLDRTGDGTVSVDDIRKVYSVKCNPRYMSGEETAELTLNNFLAHFERDVAVDGKMTLEDFMNYYSGISVSIDNDCYFDLMMRQEYNLK